jgi:hypothetical protein
MKGQRVQGTDPHIHNLSTRRRCLASNHSRSAVSISDPVTDRVGPELVWISW